MKRRKKFPKLPNGYGSIKYLGDGRRNPYGVFPPVTEFDIDGKAINNKAICYVDTWEKGFYVLTALKAGKTKEEIIEEIRSPLFANDKKIIDKILQDYAFVTRAHARLQGLTFADVYDRFFAEKYNGQKEYSKSTIAATKAAYKNCKTLHDKPFSNLRHDDLQSVVDCCPLKHSSKELILLLFHQMYRYADIHELVEKDYSAHVRINTPDDDVHGVPFSDRDLSILWLHKDDPTAEMLLIMCFTGMRISEYKTAEVDIDQKYIKGGVKTAAGKNRIIPIHDAIVPLIRSRLERYGGLLPLSIPTFRNQMVSCLTEWGIEHHTPHDCRHTFSALCERYGISLDDRKRLLGHKIDDITAGTYGHRSLDDLRVEINKIHCY